MGYQLRVWRTDGLGEDRKEDVEGAGGTCEATVEGLDPWTHYQVQIQAYNSIGPGPWSNTVGAHTAESGGNSDLIYSCHSCASVHQSCVVNIVLAGRKKTDGSGIKCSDYLPDSLFLPPPLALYTLPLVL